MKSMKPVFDQYDELVKSIRCHAKCAMESKDDLALSAIFKDLASNELASANKIHMYAVEQGTTVEDPEEAKKILEQMWTEKQQEMGEELSSLKTYLSTIK